MDNNFYFNHKDKLLKCLNCEHCKFNFTLSDDYDFWYSVSCDKHCPGEISLDCLQCLLCCQFEECYSDNNQH